MAIALALAEPIGTHSVPRDRGGFGGRAGAAMARTISRSALNGEMNAVRQPTP